MDMFAVVVDGTCDEYQIPFFDCVANDPSFDEMKKIVCEDGQRPEIPLSYQDDPVNSSHLSKDFLCFIFFILLNGDLIIFLAQVVVSARHGGVLGGCIFDATDVTARRQDSTKSLRKLRHERRL